VTASGATGTVGLTKSIALTGVSASGTVGNVAVFYWKLIDDSQSATWQNVDTAQAATWALVDTAM
jgi:hypothetical protein